MKVKANKEFEWILDSTVGRSRVNGEIFEVDEDRANVLIEKGLVIPMDMVIEEKKPKRRARKQ